MKRIHPPDVYVADTRTARGRGVFAGRAFRKGEVVEVAPVIVLENREVELIGNTVLRTYDFDWRVLAGTGHPATAIAGGYGSLYNHSNPANLRYRADPDTPALVFTAVRAIECGEELTINYNARGGGAAWHDDNWFEQEGVMREGD